MKVLYNTNLRKINKCLTVFISSGGLRPGDIITQINSKDVSSATDVYSAVESQKDLRITVKRGHETLSVTVVPENVE